MSAGARSRVAAGGAALRVTVIIAAIAAAVEVRLLLGGAMAAASIPAALVFAAAALGVAAAAGWRPRRGALRDAPIGVAGAVLLVAVWAGSRPTGIAWHGQLGALGAWTAAVALVAVAEEAVLRGALFTAVSTWRGQTAALLATSAVFALMHLPLYGAQALPVDLAVGFLLGGLRILSGGVAAPAVAHALADIAGGWLG